MPVFGWKDTTARVEHTDIYGVKINPKEIYWKRDVNFATESYDKLSMRSMEIMMFCIFSGH